MFFDTAQTVGIKRRPSEERQNERFIYKADGAGHAIPPGQLQLFLIVVGALFLLGAIFRWKWICDPQGDNTQGFLAFVYRNFGEKGYRVITGISGAVIILCGAFLLFLF